jgi:hypothetical protein
VTGCLRFALTFAIVLLAAGPVARADDAPAGGEESVDQTLCRTIDIAAIAHRLPIGFLTRLIWAESNLRTDVTSPAGAQGVAQFMPGTAADRRLANPFDPETAIPEAANFLAELAAQFGNLGLAAAAYNAGPTRVANWRAGQGALPFETQAFVLKITGHAAEEWDKGLASDAAADAPKPEEACLPVVAALRGSTPVETVGTSPFAPWGVQLAGNFSRALALAAFARAQQRFADVLKDGEPFILASRLRSRGSRAFFRVRWPEPTQAAARQLCRRLESLGGACIVLRS